MAQFPHSQCFSHHMSCPKDFIAFACKHWLTYPQTILISMLPLPFFSYIYLLTLNKISVSSLSTSPPKRGKKKKKERKPYDTIATLDRMRSVWYDNMSCIPKVIFKTIPFLLILRIFYMSVFPYIYPGSVSLSYLLCLQVVCYVSPQNNMYTMKFYI